MGKVRSTKVTDLENCFAKVLSKTRPYMPPSSLETSHRPVVTLLASHVPCQYISLSPMLFNFSAAAEEVFRCWRGSCITSVGCRPGVSGPSKVDKGSLGVGAMPAPGCLKMPNRMDFLCG